MIQPWKRLKRTLLFEHPRLTVYEDVVQLPNNHEILYLLAPPPKYHSVSVIAVNAEGEILIQQQYSYPIDEVMWELPGGGMQANETPQIAAVRELAEEAKYTAKDIRLLGSYFTQNRFKAAKQHVLLCQDLQVYNLPADESEFIDTRWVGQQELAAMITRGDIDNINMLASLKLYDQYLAAQHP